MDINEIYLLIESSSTFTCFVEHCFDGELNKEGDIWKCSECGEIFTDDDIAEFIEDQECEMVM